MSGTGSAVSQKSGTLPPGPINPLRTTLAFQRGPLDLFDDLIANYGDISSFRLAATRIVLSVVPGEDVGMASRRWV